jgi:predicted transcriptional regulator of viral defense system
VIETSKSEALLELARKRGVVRSSDLKAFGIPREYLSRLEREGILERASRGIGCVAKINSRPENSTSAFR